MPNDDAVDRNLQGMDELDFVGWNNADWTGVFAHHHTDDVLVDWQGQPTDPRHRGAHRGHEVIRRTERGRYTAADHVPPDQVRVRRVDVRRRGVRQRCPYGDRSEMARTAPSLRSTSGRSIITDGLGTAE